MKTYIAPVLHVGRLSPLITPAVERSPSMNLTLREAIVVGSHGEQAKFRQGRAIFWCTDFQHLKAHLSPYSELTLDMFRMLQTLEREPREEIASNYEMSPAPGKMPPFVST